MSPAVRRVAIVVAGIAVLIVAFLLLSGGKDDKTSSTATTQPDTIDIREAPTVRVVDGKPDGGVKKLKFNKGDVIAFRVVSDTAGEIHVHGYDIHADVTKGGTARFSFRGRTDGRFVVELEATGTQIAELDVNP